MRVDVRSLGREEIAEYLKAAGAPGYRLDQVLGWLYRGFVSDWEEMSNLPRDLRRRLAESFELGLPAVVRVQGSDDTTRKYLWRLRDGALIESVLIPATPALYGESSDRHTLCLSTQVGCAYGCRFCASGLDGWKRNLTPSEILGQVIAIERLHRRAPDASRSEGASPGESRDDQRAGSAPAAAERSVNNLVIMGMGEPLANLDNLLKALETANASWGLGIGARKITISTSGLVPEMRRLAAQPRQYGLAISLHAARDEVRNRLMPVNRKYPLAALMAAAGEYVRVKGRMITLEYILIAGINDDPAEARLLAGLARRLQAKVNLIPYNRVEGLEWERPSPERQQAFLGPLEQAGIRATLRIEKGHDIDAACGQLRLRTERGLVEG